MINSDYGPIQYTEFGEGASMLIIHRAGGGYEQGEYFAKLIGRNFHWIAPSRLASWVRPYPKAQIHRFKLMHMPACWIPWVSIG